MSKTHGTDCWSFFISTSSVLDCQWSWPACVAWNVVSDLTVMDVGSITDPHHVSCGFSNENKSESREENGEALEMSLREHGSSAEESTVPVEQSLSHQEAFAHFRKGLKQLLDDQLLKYLPEDVSLKEVEMQLALHQGRAITVFIQRLDGQTVAVPVLQGARVKDLKAAIQLHIAKQVKRSGGPTHISWRSVWRSYWLSCNKVRFTDENALLSDYGVGNRDTVVFLKRLREHGIRSWLAQSYASFQYNFLLSFEHLKPTSRSMKKVWTVLQRRISMLLWRKDSKSSITSLSFYSTHSNHTIVFETTLISMSRIG